MAELWYCRINGKQHGPLPFAQLKQMADAGQLSRTDFARPAADPKWHRAGDIPHLFAASANAQPLASPPAKPESPQPAPIMAAVVPVDEAIVAELAPELPSPATAPVAMSGLPTFDESLAAVARINATERERAEKRSQADMLPYTIVWAVVGIATLVGGVATKVMLFSGRSVEKELQEIVEVTKPTLPKQIDSETRVDSVTAGPGRRVTYRYTLTNVEVTGNSFNKNELIRKMKPALIANVREGPNVDFYRKNQVELRHIYHDKVGHEILTVTLAPDEL